MIKELIKLARDLDEAGQTGVADKVDEIISSLETDSQKICAQIAAKVNEMKMIDGRARRGSTGFGMGSSAIIIGYSGSIDGKPGNAGDTTARSKAAVDAAIAAGGGGIPEAPTDGFGYARQSSGWTYTPTFDSIVLGATSTITFSDASVQTTAAFNNLADHLTALVFDVTWTGSAWSIDFQPINGFINARMSANELQIYSASGVDNVSGLSTTTTSTFTTTNAGQYDNIYLRLINAGATYTSTLPINLP